jgi:histidine triad (HIT) family protein
MKSIFTKIIAGEIHAYKISENESCIAILDAFPLRLGHTLIIPKMEIDIWHHLPESQYLSIMQKAFRVAQAIAKVIPCNRVSQHIIGLEVPHAHMHLIPINCAEDCDFSAPKPIFTPAQFQATASSIQLALTTL